MKLLKIPFLPVLCKPLKHIFKHLKFMQVKYTSSLFICLFPTGHISHVLRVFYTQPYLPAWEELEHDARNEWRTIKNNSIFVNYDFNDMELWVTVCNKKVKCYGSLKTSVNVKLTWLWQYKRKDNLDKIFWSRWFEFAQIAKNAIYKAFYYGIAQSCQSLYNVFSL